MACGTHFILADGFQLFVEVVTQRRKEVAPKILRFCDDAVTVTRLGQARFYKPQARLILQLRDIDTQLGAEIIRLGLQCNTDLFTGDDLGDGAADPREMLALGLTLALDGEAALGIVLDTDAVAGPPLGCVFFVGQCRPDLFG